jgi:hypothetical protein
VFLSLPSLSAYSRQLAQLCVTLGNISAIILSISTGFKDARQVLTIAITSLASCSITLYDAFYKKPVLAELAWLASGTDGVVDNSPLLEILGTNFGEIVWLFALNFTLFYRKRGELAVCSSLILLHFAQINDLYKEYEPYVDIDAVWSCGQVLVVVYTWLPMFSILGMF